METTTHRAPDNNNIFSDNSDSVFNSPVNTSSLKRFSIDGSGISTTITTPCHSMATASGTLPAVIVIPGGGTGNQQPESDAISQHSNDIRNGGGLTVGHPESGGQSPAVSKRALYQAAATTGAATVTATTAVKLSKHESLKVQKRHYRHEKKRATAELMSTLTDPLVIILSDWLKIRGLLKSWTRLWCVLKPGLLILYKTEAAKSSHWVGTVLLNSCELIERPSKKDGFCFKVFHPLEKSIWATKGPRGEAIGAMFQPLPYSYLIFRAPSEAADKETINVFIIWKRVSHYGLVIILDHAPSNGHRVESLVDHRLALIQEKRLPTVTRDPCKCWMDALELALRCTNLLMRTMTRTGSDIQRELGGRGRSGGWEQAGPSVNENGGSEAQEEVVGGEHLPPHLGDEEKDSILMCSMSSERRQNLNDSDCERHFYNCGLDEDTRGTDREERTDSETDDDKEEEEEGGCRNGGRALDGELVAHVETPYVEDAVEELGQPGDASQTEEVADENKGLIWSLVKQVRPGMDLSQVTLPTFILEPRSLLDKLTDYYYHADLLSEAALEEDAFTRIKMVVRWYVSGFYKKPKGLKKPYNPILGEVFRCHWSHPKTGSRTFYIAEQISHHPPVSAFYITNRRDSFSLSGSTLIRSKFYGNSLSAILDGTARLMFLKRGEEYSLTMPYAHCKGILIGTLTMELGGHITIACEKTGYWAELDFKLKPFLGSGAASNRITGRIKLGDETLATIDGHWDQEIFIKDKRSGETELFWNPTSEVRSKRLRRCTVPIEAQADFESEKLWMHTSAAIERFDDAAATREKRLVEDVQRSAARERKMKMIDWTPRLFEQNPITGDWVYKYTDVRPWDSMNDVIQYERDFVITTKTHHQTPTVHTMSITNVDNIPSSAAAAVSRGISIGGGGAGGCGGVTRERPRHVRTPSSKHSSVAATGRVGAVAINRASNSSLSAYEEEVHGQDDVGDGLFVNGVGGGGGMGGGVREADRGSEESVATVTSLTRVLEPLVRLQEEQTKKLAALQTQISDIQCFLKNSNNNNRMFHNRDHRDSSSRDSIVLVLLILLSHYIFYLCWSR